MFFEWHSPFSGTTLGREAHAQAIIHSMSEWDQKHMKFDEDGNMI